MSVKPQIIYLSEVIFSHHMNKAFGVEILQKTGYVVELWDVSAVFHPEYNKNCKSAVLESVFNKVLVFNELQAVLNAINIQHHNTIFVLFMWYRFESYPIFRALSRDGHFFGLQLQNNHPAPNYKARSFLRTFCKLIKKPRQVINKLFTLFPPHVLRIKSADFYIAGGKSTINHQLIDKYTTIIWTSAHDYSIYLGENNINIGNNSDYIVFLDNYWPYHEDFILLGQPLITPGKYYPKMCNLFDRVEKKLGINIVIAAHPKSCYEDKPDLFGGRSIYKGSSASLVKNACMVIAHDSLSLNFAILYKIPVLFIKFDFDPVFDGEVIPDAMAEAFGKKAINLDDHHAIDQIDYAAEMTVDAAAYDEYREKYIVTQKGIGKNNWEIVAEYFDTLSAEVLNKKRSSE